MPLVHGGMSYLSSFPPYPGMPVSCYQQFILLTNDLEVEWNILRVLIAQRVGFTDTVGPPYRREVFESRTSSRWRLHRDKRPWGTKYWDWFLWMWKVQPRPCYPPTSGLSVPCNNQVSQDSRYFWLSCDFRKTLLHFKNFCFWILSNCKSVNRWHWDKNPEG